MSEQPKTDEKLLRALLVSAGVNPDGPLAPDIEAIAKEDRPLTEKVDKVAEAIQETANNPGE